MLISILIGILVMFVLFGVPTVLFYADLDSLAFLWIICSWGGAMGYCVYDEQQTTKASSITIEISE